MDNFITRLKDRRREKLKKKRKKQLILFFSLFFAGIVVFTVCYFKVNNINLNNSIITFNNSSEEKGNGDAINTLTLSFVGNIICYTSQTKDALNSDKISYDFSYIFENVKSYLKNSDIVLGTLETNFFVNEQNKYDDFNTPIALANSLKNIGFDILFTATNHSLDMKFDGLKATLNTLDSIRNITHRLLKKLGGKMCSINKRSKWY